MNERDRVRARGVRPQAREGGGAPYSMTDTPQSPWWIVPSDDKKRARINCISHLLSVIPYERIPLDKPVLGKRNKRPRDFTPDRSTRNVVPDVS